MGKAKSNTWGAISGQMETIASEARQGRKSVTSKPDDAVALQPREVASPDPVPVPAAAASEKPSQVKRTSTSLYLTPAAHQAIRMYAAEKGMRPHRVYDDALRAFFEAKGIGDFDKLNGTEP